MNPAGFEPAIPASKLPLTHALDRAATGIGRLQNYTAFKWEYSFYILNCHIANSFNGLEAGLEIDTTDISTTTARTDWAACGATHINTSERVKDLHETSYKRIVLEPSPAICIWFPTIGNSDMT